MHTRQSVGVRRHKSLKPKTDTERQVVYATVMSVKEVRMYPGRSRLMHESATAKSGLREVSSGHTKMSQPHRRAKRSKTMKGLSQSEAEDAESGQ